MHTTTNSDGRLIGALLDEKQGGYSGQFSSNRYNSLNQGTVKVTENDRYTVFDFGSEKGIGKTRSVTLGDDTFTVALMIPEAQFDAFVLHGQMKTTIIIFAVMLVMLAYCLFTSKKYVAPILRKLEQLKYSESDGEQLKIREIDDLLAHFEERASAYEKQLNILQQQRKPPRRKLCAPKRSTKRPLRNMSLPKVKSCIFPRKARPRSYSRITNTSSAI